VLNRDDQSIMDMVDREAIRNMVLAYFDAIWRDDIEALVQLFAPDGTMVVSGGPGSVEGSAPVGHEQLRDFYVNGVKLLKPRPFSHNHVVELLGEGRAMGRAYIEMRSSVDFEWVAAVVYSDEYVKIGDEWKIQVRRAAVQHFKESW
jgi:ketosteroid isomerase-like protein